MSTDETSQDVTKAAAVTDIGTGPTWLQLALIVTLTYSLALGAITLVTRIDPTGPWRMMPLYALAVALESAITGRWLARPMRERLGLAYRLAELVFLLTLAPLALWLSSGQVPVPTSLVDVLQNPLTVFSVPLLLYMLLAVLVWQQTHSWTDLFAQLAINEYEVRYYTSTPAQRAADRSIILPIKHRTALLNRFVQGWIAGGIFLIAATALVSFDLREVADSLASAGRPRTVTRLGLGPDLLLALLAYFLGGLWLISQGRIAVLKGRWLADGSQRDLAVVARWRSWAFVLIVVLSLLAMLLPIGTTYPLFQVMQSLIRVLTNVVGAIFGLVIMAIYFILSLLPSSAAPERPPVNLSELVLPDQAPVETSVSAPALLAGSVFWLVIIALTVAATLHFLSSRGPDVSLDQLRSLWRRLQDWLLDLRHGAAARVASFALPLSLRPLRPSRDEESRSAFRFFRIGALPPREQVRFLYLSLIRHAEKQGNSRPPAATPGEFSQNLKGIWPEASDDLDELTGSFITARYSPADIGEQRLLAAKAALRRLRRRKKESAEEAEA